MPSYRGPYLAAPEKPQLDPAVLHLVDLAKGNIVPAPGWGGPVTPGAVSTASTGGANTDVGAGHGLSLPKRAEADLTFTSAHGGCCLSPAAHEAGKLTYGIYEGGGVATKPLATSPIVSRSGCRRAAGAREGGEAEAAVTAATTAAAAKALEEQIQAEEQDRAGGAGVAVVMAAVEYAESALPVVNTPRVALRSPRGESSREPAGSNDGRTTSMSTPRGDGELGFYPGSVEEQANRRSEATARSDTEMEVALWIEGVTGETFPGKFWSSLKDGGEKDKR